MRIQKLLELRKFLQHYYLKKAGIELSNKSTPSSETAKIAESVIEGKREDSFVKKVREAVESNLTDLDFTVEKLCRRVFMSHSQLHRKLEALTGCSPNKFIRMIRLKRASEMLQHPSNSISSVALDCDYADPGYFARVFKQKYGLTPQEWRNKVTRNSGSDYIA